MRKHLQKMGLALVVALLLSTQAQVFAASGSIGIIPAYPQTGNQRSKGIFIHTLNGGDTAEDGVRIFNYTDEERTVILGAVDSIAASDGSFSCKQNTEKREAVGTWVQLSEEKVVVPAKSNITVGFTIAVPKGTSPGEHNGCITAQDTKNFAPKSGQGVLLGFRNAIRMAITVPGDLVKKLSYERVDIKRIPNGNYTVSPVLTNEGNVSLDVTSRVQLRGLFGSKSEIKTANYPIIRDATTGWPFEFKRPFWGGIYRAYTSVSYNANPQDGLGVNTADQKRIRQDTEYFVMLPAPQAMAVELGIPLLLVLAAIAWMYRKRRQRRIYKKWQKYTVTDDDTIMTIAAAYGMKWKNLAKVNRIKAPYLLKKGTVILVPNEQSARKKRKGKKNTWTVNNEAEQDAYVNHSEGAQPQRDVTNDSRQQPTSHHASNAEFESPREAPSHPARIATGQGWQSPLASDDEPKHEGPDWREGASDDELRAIGVLHDSSAVPTLQNTWQLDDADEGSSKKPKKQNTTTKASKGRRGKTKKEKN